MSVRVEGGCLGKMLDLRHRLQETARLLHSPVCRLGGQREQKRFLLLRGNL